MLLTWLGHDTFLRDKAALFENHVIKAAVGYDKLLEHFDPDFFLFESLSHLFLGLFLGVFLQGALDEIEYADELVVDQVLLEEVIFELATAHQEALEQEEEAFTAVGLVLVQVCLQRPEERMSDHSSVAEGLFE